MSDNLTGIFDHLDPGDFERTSSAVHEESRRKLADTEFDQFVQTQLRAVRHAFAGADGRMNPIAILTSPTVERMFAPEDDETMGQYIDRLAREAHLIGANWLFISHRTSVGILMTPEGADVPVADDPKMMAEAVARGEAQEAVYWYAENCSATETLRRHGFLTIVGTHLGQLVEGEADQKVKLFGRILDGGSGRRRF
jgi:hypothetical protein